MNNYYKNIEIIKQASEELISLKEAKEFMRINNDESDQLINNLIIQSRKYAEDLCNLSFTDKTYQITYNLLSNLIIMLPYGPINKIEKIEYILGGTTILFTNYFFNINTQELYMGSRNIPNNGLLITYSTKFDKNHINYEEVKSALIFHINLLYKERLPDSSLLCKINNLYKNIRKLRLL